MSEYEYLSVFDRRAVIKCELRGRAINEERFIRNHPACRRCGCTDADCFGCIVKTGEPCSWVDVDLCSACAREPAPVSC